MTEHVCPSLRDLYAGRIFPKDQFNAYRNMQAYFPVRHIQRGNGDVRPLPKSQYSIDDLTFESAGQSYDLVDYVSRNRVAGLLVLKQGETVFENYEYGCDQQTRWMSMSMAKSISTTLVGVAIEQGHIESINDPLVKYLPRLAKGVYADVTVRQLMLMASGVEWLEDQTNPDSHRRQVLDLQLAQQSGSILSYMSELPRVASVGSSWNYSTGETHVVGELIKAATGRWLSDYLSETIWSRLGMESDAYWWLEADDGLEIAGSGVGATLRDYGRFGLFVQNGGVIDGEQVLPSWWLPEAAGPTLIGNQLVPYGYMWWTVPDGDPADRAFAARGIFGQRLYINPAQELVIVVWSARSKPMGDEPIKDNDFFNAVNNALKSEK